MGSTQLTVKITNEDMVLVSSSSTVYCNLSNLKDLTTPSDLLKVRQEIIALARERGIALVFTEGTKKTISSIGNQAVEEHSSYRNKFAQLRDHWKELSKDGVVVDSESPDFLAGYKMRDRLRSMLCQSTALRRYVGVEQMLLNLKKALAGTGNAQKIAI